MSFSPRNESAFNDTKMRSGKVTPCSGMCSFCTAECVGTCEVGLAAILGKAAVYPTNTGNNQIAAETRTGISSVKMSLKRTRDRLAERLKKEGVYI